MRKAALLWLILVVIALMTLGFVVLFTASGENAFRIHRDVYYFVKHQAIYAAAGVVLAACVAFFDYRNWKNHLWLTALGYAVVFACLLAVFEFKPFNGSYRWIPLRIGPLNIGTFQPSEFAKLFVVIGIAVWAERLAWRVELFWRGAVVSAVIMGLLCVPVMREPDFGSVIVMGCTGFLVMLLSGVRLAHIALLFTVCSLPLIYKIVTNANRMARIAAFFGVKLSIGAEVANTAAARAAYQAHQALVAICNGGYWGVGLGESMQKQYYLPEAHTDFVFAIGAEEFGLFFSIAVIVLFLLFFCLSLYIAAKACDQFGRTLAFGMAFILFFEAMINLGVVCEAFPTKGMALPFFSYGGTNMIAACFAVGTILSVGIQSIRSRHGKSNIA